MISLKNPGPKQMSMSCMRVLYRVYSAAKMSFSWANQRVMRQPAMEQKVCCAHAACFGSRTFLGQGYRVLQILILVHKSL